MNEKYVTTDLGLCCALITAGHPLDCFDTSEKRVKFIFKTREDMDRDVTAFYENGLPVDARTFFENIKMVKSRLHSQSVNK